MPRSYDEFSSKFLLSLPTDEEMRAFSDAELERIGRLANMLDNLRYLEKSRRDKTETACKSG